MKIKKKDWALISQLLMSASVVALFLAGVGYLGTDIWLASTQWVIIAGVLAMFGIYARMNIK